MIIKNYSCQIFKCYKTYNLLIVFIALMVLCATEVWSEESMPMDWDTRSEVVSSNTSQNEISSGDLKNTNQLSVDLKSLSLGVDKNTGAAIQTIELQVPHGRGDVRPDLSIKYNSMQGEGWLGVGYDLVVGSIRRSTKHGLSYTNNNFEVVTSSGVIELVPRSEWGAGYYGAKIENDFTRYLFTNNGFLATTRDGLKYYYGSSSSSREDYPQGVFQWHLDRIEDTNSNYLTVAYNRPPATSERLSIFSQWYYTYRPLYISEVKYSGNTNASILPYYSVKFSLENIDNKIVTMLPGQRVINEYRLSSVSIYMDINNSNTLVGKYNLSYEANELSGSFRLSMIQRIGYNEDGSLNYAPPLSINWKNGWDKNYTALGQTLIPNTKYSPILGDVDGDGQDEVVLENSIYHYDNGTGTFSSVSLNVNSFYSWDYCKPYGVDVNGDGKVDIVITKESDDGYMLDFKVFLSNGDGTFGINSNPNFSKQISTPYTDTDLRSDPVILFADLTGRRMGDVLIFYKYSQRNYLKIAYANEDGSYSDLNTMGGIFNNVPIGYPLQSDAFFGIGDVNGDGRSDIVFKSFDVADFTGEHFPKIVTWISNPDKSFSLISQSDFLISSGIFADFNGDGRSDIIDKDGDLSLKRKIYLSKGDGTFNKIPIDFYLPSKCLDTNSSLFPVFDGVATNLCLDKFGDINGDGRTDLVIVYYKRNQTFYGARYCEINFAIANNDGSLNLLPNPISYSGLDKLSVILADISGDGAQDIFVQQVSPSLLHYFNIELAAQGKPDLLSSFNNGQGGIDSINYQSSSRLNNFYLPFNLSLVSRITHDGGFGALATTDYMYEGGFYDRLAREYRGFALSTVLNPDQSREITSYYQDEYFKGKPASVEYYDASLNGGSLLRKDINTWESVFLTSDSKFVRLANKLTSFTDSSPAAFINKQYSYSGANGLVEQVITSGTGNHGAITEKTTFENFGTWCWRPVLNAIYEENQLKIRQTTYGYFEDDTANLKFKELWWKEKPQGGGDQRTSYTYDDFGNVVTEVDPMLNVTTTEYESKIHTFPTKITRPSTNGIAHIQEYPSYDYRFGLPTSDKEENGNMTYSQYDSFGRLVQKILPDGGQTNIGYFDYASPVYTTTRVRADSAGSTIDSYNYFDGLGRQIETIALGEEVDGTNKSIVQQYYFDEMGRNYLQYGPFFGVGTGFTQTPPAEFQWQQNYYDGLGRTVRRVTPDEVYSTAETLFQYSGFTKSIIDPDQRRKDEKYNYLRQLEEVFEYGDNNQQIHTYYTYDGAGDLLTIKNALGHIATTGYDSLGRKVFVNDPDMGYWSYAYDQNNNLKTQVDAKNQTISYDYDELNRVTSKTYSTDDPQVVYGYDSPQVPNGVGRLASVTNGLVTTSYDAYDAMGRQLAVTRDINGAAQNYTTYYGYDLAGRQRSIVYPDGYLVANSYYPHSSLLRDVTGEDGIRYALFKDYEPNAKIGRIFHGNDTATTFTYDPWSSRLTAIVTEDPSALPANDLQRKQYSYSPAGDITNIWDDLRGINYMYWYDSFHRLKAEMVTGNTTGFQQRDEELNYDYNHPSHIHAVSNINSGGIDYAYGYDANGNLETGPDFTKPGAPGTRQLEFNADNLPTVITHSAEGFTSLTYDGDGVRTIKDSGGKVTLYVNNLFEVIDGVNTKYIFGNNLRLAKVLPTSINYFHKDHLNSSVVMSDEQGLKIEASENFPYGLERLHDGVDASDYKYTDQELDRSGNLYNYDSRLYDPSIGLYLSPDTIEPDYTNPQTLNKFSYVLNNPLKYTDPTGHEADDASGDAAEPSVPGNSSFLSTIWSGLVSAIPGMTFSNNMVSSYNAGNGLQTLGWAAAATAEIGMVVATYGSEPLLNRAASATSEVLFGKEVVKGVAKSVEGVTSAGARTEAHCLAEQLALEEAKAGAGSRIMKETIRDPKFPADTWAKMQHVHNSSEKNIVIHYWERLDSSMRTGFKFKD